MIRPKFTFKQTTIKLALLKKHKLVDEMGYLKPDELYVSQLSEILLQKYPIVTEDLYYLTQPDFIEAMLALGADEIEVLVITGATINDLMKIINFESRPWYRASKSLLYKTVKTLQNHFWNTTEGKAWKECLPGDDINEVIGALVGYSKSTISNIKFIGDRDYALLDKIDDPDEDMTLTRARLLIEQGETMDRKKDNYSEFNDEKGEDELDDEDEDVDGTTPEEPEMRPGTPGPFLNSIPLGTESKPAQPMKAAKPKKEKVICDAKLTGFSVSLGKYGNYTLDDSNGRTALIMNGKFAGFVHVDAEPSNNPNEKLQFIMQNPDEGWSFHVIATRIYKLLKKQEVDNSNA